MDRSWFSFPIHVRSLYIVFLWLLESLTRKRCSHSLEDKYQYRRNVYFNLVSAGTSGGEHRMALYLTVPVTEAH